MNHMSALLQNPDQIENLRQRLARCRLVAQYGQEESGTLVHAFSDLEESFRRFLDEQLPKLADPSVQGEQLEELLMDVQQEFRHILYHLHDPQLFHVLEPTHEWLTLADTKDR
jgi:hypothetical protein